jgi:hypothetical protein
MRMFDTEVEEATPDIDLNGAATTTSDGADVATIADSDGALKAKAERIRKPRVAMETVCPSNERLWARLQELDKKSKSKKKPVSAAATKVKQSQMKSTAKGDGKRVKVDERFFVDLVLAEDDGIACHLRATPVFLNRSDPIERLLTDCATTARRPGWCHEFLVPATDGGALLRITDSTQRLGDAESKGLLNGFDRIVLRVFPS